MPSATATFISDTTKFLRDSISAGVTDPLASSRAGRERWVMTAYPQRQVKYPIITVRHLGSKDIARSGMRSEVTLVRMTFEIRVWARNEKEKDELTEQVYNHLRSNQFGGGSSSSDDQDIHDFKITSSVPVDEVGENAVKSQVMNAQYMFVLGS